MYTGHPTCASLVWYSLSFSSHLIRSFCFSIFLFSNFSFSRYQRTKVKEHSGNIMVSDTCRSYSLFPASGSLKRFNACVQNRRVDTLWMPRVLAHLDRLSFIQTHWRHLGSSCVGASGIARASSISMLIKSLFWSFFPCKTREHLFGRRAPPLCLARSQSIKH